MEDITSGLGGAGIILPIVIAVVALILIGFTIASRYKVASPDEAILIAGSGAKRGEKGDLPAAQKIVQGGGVFVIPFVQKAHSISLSSRQIEITVNAISQNGIRLRLEGVSIVKVGGDDQSVRAAAQRFLGKQDEINNFTAEVLSGSLRSIVGNMTVEDIISNRQVFAQKVSEEAESALTGQGLILDTFQIQEINDVDGSYLTNLGRPEEARIKQRAATHEAEARREAKRAEIAADQEILNSQRELDLREAEIRRETDAAKAEAEAAGPRAQARARQEVLDEEQKVAERQAQLREQELVAEINKKADAERYREEQEAEARRHASITAAEAEAERVRLQAEADANRVKLAAGADAEHIRLAGEAEASQRRSIAEAVEDEGRAEATATREKGLAEAEAMNKKAEAYRNYGQAAIIDRFVDVLPAVIKAGSDPISNIDKMTVIDSEGASKITKAGVNNVSQGLETFSDILGVDLRGLVSGFAGDFAKDKNNSESIENNVDTDDN